MVLEKVLLLPSFYFLDKKVMEKGGGGKPLPFLKTARALRMGLVLCDPEPRSASVAKIACNRFTCPLRRDLNSFSPEYL